MLVPLTVACLRAIASAYDVPEPDLWTIMSQEHGKIGQVVENKNKTVDIGPFQVNSTWIHTFTTTWEMPADAVTREKLTNNGCWNAAAGAAIYRLYLTEANGDRRRAIGYYHSHTARLAEGYTADFNARYQRLFGSPAFRDSIR